MSFLSYYQRFNKHAAAMLTPQAQQAVTQPPPPPMDPSMMGAPVDPNTGAPMDPSMMGAQGGAPMDPSMMGAPVDPNTGAPMDPSMMGAQGGAPGGQGMWMQDPMFLQFLQAIGFVVNPDGSVIDPNGQPADPVMMDQLYAEFMAQQEQMGAQGGAPMDPSMMGAPVDPNTGAPMDPSMMGASGDVPVDPNEDMINNIASIVNDTVDVLFDQKIAAIQKKISAFSDKLDSIKMMLDDFLTDSSKADKKEKEEAAAIDAQIEKDLKQSVPVEETPVGSTMDMLPQQQTVAYVPQATVPVQGNLLDVIRGV